MVKVTTSELFFFFIYVRDVHKRKPTKKKISKNFILYSFYEHLKLPSAATRFWKNVLKANFEIIFWEKPWPPHSYLTFTWKYPKRNVPKKLSSHVVVKASLRAIPQNHQKKRKKYQLWGPLSQDALTSTEVRARGQEVSHLSNTLKLLKVQDNKITLSFMCLFVINYSAYQKRRNKQLSKTKTLTLVWVYILKIYWNKKPNEIN